MIESSKFISISNWLKTKFINGENGIIIEPHLLSYFNPIQEFVGSFEHRLKTPVIYYQAFPEESAVQFLDTLRAELVAKLANSNLNEYSLLEIIKITQLKMVIIDKCHLHPSNTLQSLLDFFSCCGVTVILVSSNNQIAISPVLNHPTISQWDKLTLDDESQAIFELS